MLIISTVRVLARWTQLQWVDLVCRACAPRGPLLGVGWLVASESATQPATTSADINRKPLLSLLRGFSLASRLSSTRRCPLGPSRCARAEVASGLAPIRATLASGGLSAAAGRGGVDALRGLGVPSHRFAGLGRCAVRGCLGRPFWRRGNELVRGCCGL